MLAVFKNFHTDVRGGKCSVDISCRSLIAYFHFQLSPTVYHRPVPIPSDVSRRTRRKFLAQLRPCTLIESGYKRDRSAASENRLRAHSSFCAVLVFCRRNNLWNDLSALHVFVMTLHTDKFISGFSRFRWKIVTKLECERRTESSRDRVH